MSEGSAERPVILQPEEPVTAKAGLGVRPSEPAATHDSPLPVRGAELVAVLLLVVLADMTIYRGQGFAGYALLFVLAPMLILLGAFRPRTSLPVWVVGAMLVLLAAKTIWCGSWLLVAVGFALVAAFAVSLAGQTPFVLESLVFASQSIAAGYGRLVVYGRVASQSPIRRAPWLNVALPAAALLVFGIPFLLANPDLFASFSRAAEQFFTRARDWLLHFSLGEAAFWFATAWLSIGLLRQVSNGVATGEMSRPARQDSNSFTLPAPTNLYPAFRNTLVTVIVLFAVYLAFEFHTLWFQEFPKGFHYSGYAHEGAAWLTFALGLATVVLSLVFRGGVLADSRLPQLRRLAWTWSAENFVLAVAVYHRMFIYIDFNGMTRMRTVGLYGMTAVVVGFALVLRKIATNRNFVWLLRRQLWTLAITIYLFALTPVDMFVVRTNVNLILAGHPAPSVQISVHPISPEGVWLLEPLLDCNDPLISEGIRALLATRDIDSESLAARRATQGWTSFQIADQLLLNNLRGSRTRWSQYSGPAERAEALKQFHAYAYQWF